MLLDYFFKASFFFVLIIPITIADDEPIVNLPNGSIRGRQLTSYKGIPFSAFQEIPYAAPPVGNLRYKEAIPPENWEGILNTTSNTKICYQNVDSNDGRETEDCLYLNVYTPVLLGQDASLPVLIWVHGGGFQGGTGVYENWGPDFWMDTGIVLVTINYRLGQFGFLNTEDGVIPANLGLKDQLLAIKWVNQNIALFGGDKDKVTIGGQSAGSASVGYQLLSPLSKGLYRAGIMESGTPLCAWSYQRRSRQAAYDFAKLINDSITYDLSSEELLEFLLSVDSQTLKNTRLDYGSLRADTPYIFSPILESPDEENAFITEPMDVALQNGNFNKVPILIGVNSEEQIGWAGNLDYFKYLTSQYDSDLSLIVNEDFNIDADDVTAVGEALRSVYTDGLFQDDLGNGIRFSSDATYTTSTIRHGALQSRYTDVFLYQFSYVGQLGGAVNYTLPGLSGVVSHSGELNYFWSYQNEDLSQYSDEDVLTHDRVITMWSNFIKSLNPTPEADPLLDEIVWPKTSEDDLKYLDIDSTLEIKTDPKQYKKWKEIVDTYGHPPFDTY